jgi:pimeloyl-ACP methyl ester carboxylesterase
VLGQELPGLVADGYTSFKVFMTYEGLALADREILEVMSVARETGALVMVHAENYDAIRFLTDKLELAGKTSPRYHATSRPIVVEREATHRAISLAELIDVGLTVPTLILTGDEDWPCLVPALLMKRTIPAAALAVMPNCGHTINLEAPDLFNSIVGEFVAQVDAGRWPTRDPRAMSESITGIR